MSSLGSSRVGNVRVLWGRPTYQKPASRRCLPSMLVLGPHPFMLAFTYLAFLLPMYFISTRILPTATGLYSASVWASFTLCIVGLFLTAHTEPGIVQFNTVEDAALEECVRCGKCGERQAAETVHCEMCDVCVLESDHHCIFLSTCVGRNNLMTFYAFMLGAAMFYGLSVSLVVTAV